MRQQVHYTAAEISKRLTDSGINEHSAFPHGAQLCKAWRSLLKFEDEPPFPAEGEEVADDDGPDVDVVVTIGRDVMVDVVPVEEVELGVAAVVTGTILHVSAPVT